MSGTPGLSGRFVFAFRFGLGLLALVVVFPREADAGGRFARRANGVVPTARSVPGGVQGGGTLGSGFSRTPYLFVRGNGTAGGGYSPLGEFGDTTLSLYGPISSLRATTAPVLTYTRGYDGRTVTTTGTSFSYPNLPALTPVVYPTQANDYYGFRTTGTPPWWQYSINWLDQN